ncbi:hypothetical protein ACFLY6_03235 [Candidatus Dependentiae bacterium]
MYKLAIFLFFTATACMQGAERVKLPVTNPQEMKDILMKHWLEMPEELAGIICDYALPLVVICKEKGAPSDEILTKICMDLAQKKYSVHTPDCMVGKTEAYFMPIGAKGGCWRLQTAEGLKFMIIPAKYENQPALIFVLHTGTGLTPHAVVILNKKTMGALKALLDG